jgi:signal transduction histidine kinase
MPKAKLLVVEDEEIVAFDIESTLKSLGYTVLDVVASGEEAIASAAKMQPDLVLMDIMLKSSMDGIQTANEIRKNLNIPVLYLTAYADVNTLERAKITEPFGYIIKPFEERTLSTIIEIALSRHQAEEKMRQALEKEKHLSELKTQFINLASHEFRTPLATIRSSCDLLERYCSHLLEPKKKQHFQRIKFAVHQMIQLLEDVLIIGQSEAGKVQFNPSPLNLVEFCSELVEELQSNTSCQHKIIFTSKGDFTNACMDENLLRQILTNLLSNAIKYSSEGEDIFFDINSQNQLVTFRIQDRGIGISPQDQKQLFEPFYRAANVGKIKGTGLGLSIVKRCVEFHHAQIFVESEVGVGSTFTVKMPLVS